ncbi:MAG: hypothetical protein ABSA83_09180 [Verrucomicrobiota bacterium]|jgi:hypothetical protein
MNAVSSESDRKIDRLIYSKQLDLRDAIAFARALKVATDSRDKLTGLEIDARGLTATCAFEQGGGRKAQPEAGSTTYHLNNGLAFAKGLKILTDRHRGLVWIIIRCSGTADCWFE